MTTLTVTPIDMAAKGSYRQRKQLFRALAALEGAREERSIAQMVTAMEAVEELIRGNLETDDGTSIDEALDMCSATEFDSLISGLLGGETVPNSKSAS